MDLFFVVAVGLLLAGVLGSVVPGAGLSLVGIYLYWWSSGYATPGFVVLAAFTLVGLLAAITDQFGGAFAASAGGASAKTTALATVVSVPLLFVAGPAGLVLGIGATVLAAEFYRTRNAGRGARAAAYAAVGVLGSAVIQLVVTLSLLAGSLFVAL